MSLFGKLLQTNFKVVLLGDTTVGKTSILNQYKGIKTVLTTQPTICAGFLSTIEKISELYSLKLEIWDTAGQERFNSIIPLYYRNANCSIVVYDVCNLESFLVSKKWIKKLNINSSKIKNTVVLVGNKIDKVSSIKESSVISLANNYAKDNQINHILTSAKDDINIKELFNLVALDIYNNQDIDNKHNYNETKLFQRKKCCI